LPTVTRSIAFPDGITPFEREAPTVCINVNC
jgi:hypothetical protein